MTFWKRKKPMTTPTTCTHDASEMHMACNADGMCPICQLEVIEKLRRELAIAEPVVRAACRLVIYGQPALSLPDAVKIRTAELYDAVGKWHGA